MTRHQLIEGLALSLLAAFIYEELIKGPVSTFTAGSTGTPNAIAVPSTPPAPSVSSGSSVLSTAQTGGNLFQGSGLGNNPVPQPTGPLLYPPVNIIRTQVGVA